jgi:hypothetical protein
MADAINELRRELHKRGYDTRKNTANHYVVFDSQGDEVRTKTGKPITLPSTPSDTRALNNVVATLRDAGVLPKPKEVKATHRAAKLKKAQLRQYSDALRVELTTVMRDYRLNQTDVYHYGNWYADQHGLPHPPPANAQTMISTFLRGRSLGNESYDYLTRTISAIKASNGDVPKAAQIRRMMTASEPDTPKDEPKEIEVVGESKVKVVKTPQLAFEVMQAIYREDNDPDLILDLVTRVAKLELE